MRLVLKRKGIYSTYSHLYRNDYSVGFIGFHAYYHIDIKYSLQYQSEEDKRYIYKDSIYKPLSNLKQSKEFVILKTVKI